jgi:ring-1,2-phenylacetyl-CoA epoxidase subunit PaaD
MFSSEQILEWLQEVKDPEIPVLSLVDLGVVEILEIQENAVKICLIPTFSGCPALEYMKKDVESCLEKKGLIPNVEVNFQKEWSTNMISKQGIEKLKSFGLAPPAHISQDNLLIKMLNEVSCPKCGSSNTQLLNPFGPTLCRAIHHCHDCKETFESMKPL